MVTGPGWSPPTCAQGQDILQHMHLAAATIITSAASQSEGNNFMTNTHTHTQTAACHYLHFGPNILQTVLFFLFMLQVLQFCCCLSAAVSLNKQF